MQGVLQTAGGAFALTEWTPARGRRQAGRARLGSHAGTISGTRFGIYREVESLGRGSPGIRFPLRQHLACAWACVTLSRHLQSSVLSRLYFSLNAPFMPQDPIQDPV